MLFLEAGNNGVPIAPVPECCLANWYSSAQKRDNKQVDFLNFPQALGSRHLRWGAEAVFRTWPRFGAELCHREVWQSAPQWVGNLVVGEIPAEREVPPFPRKTPSHFHEAPPLSFLGECTQSREISFFLKARRGRHPAVISKVLQRLERNIAIVVWAHAGAGGGRLAPPLGAS